MYCQLRKRVARGKSQPKLCFGRFHCHERLLYFQCQFGYYCHRTSRLFSMKSILIFVLILFTFMLIDSIDGQGSPAASIGAYITLYKERKKLKAQRQKQRREKTRKPYTPRISPAITRRHQYTDCYYEPCRYY